MRSYLLLLKTLVFPLYSRQFSSSSLRKMSSEKSKSRNSKWRGRGSSSSVRQFYRPRASPSLQESDRPRGSISHGDAMYPKDGPSSTAYVPNKYSPTGYPSCRQMPQESTFDNKTDSQKHVPLCIETNEQTECKSQKVESSESSSICKGTMSQEDIVADACASDDYCMTMGRTQQEEDSHDNVMSATTLQLSEYSHHIFDICPVQEKSVKLVPSFLVKNRELRRERAIGQDIIELRPGMILMKKYIRHSDQVEIIKKCRELGIGSGGFYRPGYSDGAKLHLWMMCLGKNWDPETRKYEDRRSMDSVVPPVIPETFKKFVQRAIHDAHDFIKRHSNVRSVEAVLPNMTPDICIVNFYTDTGKLGLHQDRDESLESLLREIPVVSFSLGDSAEFLYGDDRDVDKANKVTLESGDVLIFGGKSRHIYHGVPFICSKTAPALLVNETNLRPGRLNLTFRQY